MTLQGVAKHYVADNSWDIQLVCYTLETNIISQLYYNNKLKTKLKNGYLWLVLLILNIYFLFCVLYDGILFNLYIIALLLNILPLSFLFLSFLFFLFPFISTSWRLITLQYCSGSCHTAT